MSLACFERCGLISCFERDLGPASTGASRKMDEQQLECFVAAILTTATVDADGADAKTVVSCYAATLKALREVGGPLNPAAALFFAALSR